jgi:hypothetical protein
MADPFQTPKQELPPSSESPGGLDELRQSVGQGQLDNLLHNFSDTDPEKRKETLKHVKTALIGAGVVAAAAYILSDDKGKQGSGGAREKNQTGEGSKSETQLAEEKPEQDVEKVQEPKKPKVEPEPEAEVLPYRPGTEKPHVSDKSAFRSQVEQIYAQEKTFFTTDNLNEYFGRNYTKFLIKEDPVLEPAGQPITFLGRPITGGINLMMLPFLKIAERKIMDLNLNYIPASNEIRGFQDRNMCVANPSGGLMDDPNIPSFHKYGLAVDIDPDTNWPKDGRGNIPDEVIMAMAEAGFACGSISDPSFFYLMNDTMHYQMRFPPDSPAGKKIIDASPIGTRYWKAISPLLDRIKQAA